MSERIPCPVCGKKLADENGLYQHAKFRHRETPAMILVAKTYTPNELNGDDNGYA